MKAFYLGKRDYRRVLQLQETIFNAKIARQVSVRRGESTLPLLPDVTLLVEHSAPVYTLGRRDTAAGLPQHSAVDVVRTRRGGGITYHGPGQLTMYPIANVQMLWKDSISPTKVRSPIEWFSWVLEESMTQVAGGFLVPTHRFKTGVWADAHGDVPARKLGAIGLQLGNWVSMHGAGFNVANDLHFFDEIVMCELPGQCATSLQKEVELRGGDAAAVGPVQAIAPMLLEKFVESLQPPSQFQPPPLQDISADAAWYARVLDDAGIPPS